MFGFENVSHTGYNSSRVFMSLCLDDFVQRTEAGAEVDV